MVILLRVRFPPSTTALLRRSAQVPAAVLHYSLQAIDDQVEPLDVAHLFDGEIHASLAQRDVVDVSHLIELPELILEEIA